MLRRLLAIGLIIALPGIVQAQNRSEMREIFVEAESHFLYGEYEDAVLLFLLLENPDNANIQYKIGVCYLHIPNEKEKAIPYLENAVKQAAYDARDQNVTETRAPLDAYFYLGNAYRITNQLDKAIATYKKFSELIRENNPMENFDFVNQEIRACEVARELEKKPVSYIPENLGEQVNLVSMNLNPAISGDETTLVFTARYGEDNMIFTSTRQAGNWLPAEDISQLAGDDKDAAPTALSYDGTELYLYKSDREDGNLYISRNLSGTWDEPVRLNRNINTKYFESHASVSKDGQTLYFCSNRPGGSGELDIYVSQKTEAGDWGQARNLGNIINTPFNETCPFITENDSLLYFSSEGHYNMGGYDIFRSRRLADGSWSKPENLGYPLNSTDNDLFLNPVQNGEAAYLSMSEGYKEMDIYRINILPPGVTRDFNIHGNISLADTLVPFNKDFAIYLIDRQKNDTVDIGYPNRQTGQYSFITKSGVYNLEFTGPGYKPHGEELAIDEYSRKNEYLINVELFPLEKNRVTEKQKWLKDSVNLEDAVLLDSAKVITDLMVEDLETVDQEREILYYTIQLMALRVRPVDVSYFSPLEGVVVILGKDGFYRYTYGQYDSRESAEAMKQQLIDMGFGADLWVKKVYRESP